MIVTPDGKPPGAQDPAYRPSLALFSNTASERSALIEVLERVSWNRVEAARIFRVGSKTLLAKIIDCGLTPPLRR